MAKKNNLKWIVPVVILLVLVIAGIAITQNQYLGSVFGEEVGEVCFPEDDPKCTILEGGYDCVCLNTILYNGEYYCDIDDVVSCPSGCNYDQPIPTCNDELECIAGLERCCLSSEDCNSGVQRSEGDPYVCGLDGWTKTRTCFGGEECVEETAYYADCMPIDWYYCTDNTRCWKSSTDTGNCYKSEDACLNNREVWCLTIDKKECIERKGYCLDGELSFRGTQAGAAEMNCRGQIGTDCWIRDIQEDIFLRGLSSNFDSLVDEACDLINSGIIEKVIVYGIITLVVILIVVILFLATLLAINIKRLFD